MNKIDGIIMAALLLYAIGGFYRGFLHEFGSLFSLMITLSATWLLYLPVDLFFTRFLSPNVSHALAFFGLLISVYAACSYLFSKIWRGVSERTFKGFVNRFFGILPGMTDGAIMIALVLTILIALPNQSIPRQQIAASFLGKPMLLAGEAIQAQALDRFGDAMRLFMPLRIVEPDPKGSVKLSFREEKGVTKPDLEKKMLAMANQERVKRGLKPLKWDDRLRDIAREHSEDMLRRGYFSHYTPEGKTVADRITAHHLSYDEVGENLAFAPTLKIAEDGLMESPGHRANILNKDYLRAGIGVIEAEPYGIMFTQVFAENLFPIRQKPKPKPAH